MTVSLESLEALEIMLDQVFRKVTSQIPRSIFIHRTQVKILRIYKTRPDRCIRTFKLRKLRRKR